MHSALIKNRKVDQSVPNEQTIPSLSHVLELVPY